MQSFVGYYKDYVVWIILRMGFDFLGFGSCVEKRLWLEKSRRKLIRFFVVLWWLFQRDSKVREKWEGYRRVLEI